MIFIEWSMICILYYIIYMIYTLQTLSESQREGEREFLCYSAYTSSLFLHAIFLLNLTIKILTHVYVIAHAILKSSCFFFLAKVCLFSYLKIQILNYKMF